MSQGRLALVTGASSGIGRAYVEALAGDGWSVVAVARRRERLEEVADHCRGVAGGVTPLVADLTDPGALARVEARVAEGVDLVVNNAGFAGYMPFADLPLRVADSLVDLHVRAVTHLTRAAVAMMLPRGSGTIVNVASLLAFSESAELGRLGRATYAGCKAFIVAFTQLVAGEVADRGIRMQVLCPGVVATEFHEVAGISRPGARMSPEEVVRASRRGLETGEVVCAPGLEDAGVVDRYHEAQREMLRQGNRPELAARYGPPPG